MMHARRHPFGSFEDGDETDEDSDDDPRAGTAGGGGGSHSRGAAALPTSEPSPSLRSALWLRMMQTQPLRANGLVGD